MKRPRLPRTKAERLRWVLACLEDAEQYAEEDVAREIRRIVRRIARRGKDDD